MTLFVVGLGLGDERDITVRGLEVVKKCTHVWLEHYTSVLGGDSVVERLSNFYEKEVHLADRELVESGAERIYEPALEHDVAFLVVGDPVCATTHSDLMLRAKQHGCTVQIIHNCGIMGAAGSSGLSLYNFGHAVSLCFFENKWRPTSFYPKVLWNRKGGLHTLCLLDIKVKEPDFQAMTRGKTKYLPPRFMSINQACQVLLEAEQRHGQQAYDPATTLCIGLARLGRDTQIIKAGTLQELSSLQFGEPLHSLIICGDLHELELQVLQTFLVEGSQYQPDNPARIPDPVLPDTWNPDDVDEAQDRDPELDEPSDDGFS